jgi:predicted RNA-binding Zn ribbon-like protein
MDDHRSPAVGGHPALDLCNTRAWRRDPGRDFDRIATPAEFARWYGAAVDEDAGRRLLGMAEREPSRAAAELSEVQALRDILIGWLDAHIDGEGGASHAAAFAGIWRAATSRATVGGGLPLRWVVPDVADFRAAGDWLALAAAELLQGPEFPVLRRCAQHDCGWFFLDRTRNHSRRWCIATDCGNLARVRAYAARKKRARSASGS